MSLAVPAALLEQARNGEVDDAAFLDCVRTSLPYAWDVITGLITDREADRGEFADNQVPPRPKAMIETTRELHHDDLSDWLRERRQAGFERR